MDWVMGRANKYINMINCYSGGGLFEDGSKDGLHIVMSFTGIRKSKGKKVVVWNILFRDKYFLFLDY